MKLTIIFKEEIEEHMKKQFGHFTNPRQGYGVRSVYMEGGYLYSTISDTVRWRMDDISRFYCEEGLQWLNLKSLFTATRNGNLAEVSAGGIYRTARIASGSWG